MKTLRLHLGEGESEGVWMTWTTDQLAYSDAAQTTEDLYRSLSVERRMYSAGGVSHTTRIYLCVYSYMQWVRHKVCLLTIARGNPGEGVVQLPKLPKHRL